MHLLVVHFLLATEPCAACAAQLASLEERLEQRWVERFEALSRELRARLPKEDVPKEDDGEKRAGWSVGASGDLLPARRMSSASSSYIAVDHKLFHEFPSAHQCANTATTKAFRVALPVDSSGAIDWAPSPTVSTATVSLSAVGGAWSSSSIQSFPAPFVVSHDSSCSADPTLNINLNTQISGTLTVGGTDLAARVSTLATGWYVGDVDADCDATCSANGLVCTAAEFARNSHELDTCDEMMAVVDMWWARSGATPPGSLSSYCDNTAANTPNFMAHFNTAINGAYVHLPAGAHAASNFDCTQTGNGDPGNKRRLCYCHPSSVSASGPYIRPSKSFAWTDLALGTGIQSRANLASFRPQYMLREGITHLRGAVQASSGSFGAGTTIATFPDALACPYEAVIAYVASSTSEVNIRVHLEADCRIVVQGTNADAENHLWLDTLSFRAAY